MTQPPAEDGLNRHLPSVMNVTTWTTKPKQSTMSGWMALLLTTLDLLPNISITYSNFISDKSYKICYNDIMKNKVNYSRKTRFHKQLFDNDTPYGHKVQRNKKTRYNRNIKHKATFNDGDM
jgi:hypothetical protein